MFDLTDICKKSERKRRINQYRYFDRIKYGLNESMHKINETFDNIEGWDELIELKENSFEKSAKKKFKEYHAELCHKIFVQIIGIIFCLIHLIGIQTGIILLNALFDEIRDEILFSIGNTHKKYDFYHNIEIISYKDFPEIDVIMITSSVGIMLLKHSGFICSNIIFQLSSSVWLLLLFLLFDFQKKNQLSKYYTNLERLVLCLSYIFLSILVGCSSSLALKEYWDILSKVYFPHKKWELINEKTILYFFSCISIFIVILINRKIFRSYNNISTKWLIITILIIYFSCFVLSNILYCIYVNPIKKNKKNKKNEIINLEKAFNMGESQTNIKQEVINELEMHKLNMNNENKNNNLENEKNGYLTQNIEKKEIITQSNLISKNGKIDNSSRNTGINSKEMNYIKFNNSYPRVENQFNEYLLKKIKLNKKKIYYDVEDEGTVKTGKACTLFGYLYFQKTFSNKNTCICYKYTGCCSWFKEKLFKADLIIIVLTEILCQTSIIGFKYILSKKLLKIYPYRITIRFYIALIILSFVTVLFYVIVFYESIKNKSSKYVFLKKLDYLGFISIILMGFSLFTFISSLCHIKSNNLSLGSTKWNNIYMAEFIYFKCIDLAILSFFDTYDNSDIFNSTLFITLEKFLWMIIEGIVDFCEPNTKILIIIQIVVSAILGLITLLCAFKNALKEI